MIASHSANATAAALLTEYGASPICVRTPAADAVVTQSPSPRSYQAGISSCAAVMCASMFTRIVALQSSRSPSPAPVPIPALAKNPSTWPACANARLSNAASATSPPTALARSPMAAAAASTRSESRSTSTACSAPRSSAAFAIASPIPPAAPVTTIRFPLRFMTGQPTIQVVRLSVLDQSPIPEGATNADALANTLDLARLADELGYHRYWLAEHHGGPRSPASRPRS